MPLYEYECSACGRRFEIIQKFSDEPATACRLCGQGPVQRLVSSPAIQFKGSGWYITDYAQKPKTDTASKSEGAADGAKTPASDGDGKKTSDAGTSASAPASSSSTSTPTAKD